MTLSVYPSKREERVENHILWEEIENNGDKNTGSYLHTTLSFPTLSDRFLKALTISLLSLTPGSYSLPYGVIVTCQSVFQFFSASK